MTLCQHRVWQQNMTVFISQFWRTGLNIRHTTKLWIICGKLPFNILLLLLKFTSLHWCPRYVAHTCTCHRKITVTAPRLTTCPPPPTWQYVSYSWVLRIIAFFGGTLRDKSTRLGRNYWHWQTPAAKLWLTADNNYSNVQHARKTT
jgi:hypothetical protein